MYWDVSEDEFFVRLDLSDAEKEILPSSVFTSSSGKNTESAETEEIEVKQGIPQLMKPKLTIRMSLSFHAKVFDPLGLVLPTRMIGMLLFRTSLQELKKELKGRIPWDEHLEGNLLA